MLSDFRSEMSLHPDYAYFDHAGIAPLTSAAKQAVIDWAEDVATHGVTHWKRWHHEIEITRQLAARLINAEEQEIALIHSTTQGVNIVAEGYPWQPGDNVVLPRGEFPSNLYPWLMLKSKGVDVRLVSMPDNHVDLKRLDQACDANTKIVACSWVGYSHGHRVCLNDLADVAHRHGALLFVDAIQGLGVLPLDVRQTPIDFLAADGHKWLLSPEGAGLFYLRREHLQRLRPIGVGWNSASTAGHFHVEELSLRTTAARYEGGTYNVSGITGLRASLEVLLKYGVAAIAQQIHDTTALAIEELRQMGALIHSVRHDENWSGIVSFDLPGKDPDELRLYATTKNVVINSRGGHTRISPHAYTSPNDIERLLEVLKSAP